MIQTPANRVRKNKNQPSKARWFDSRLLVLAVGLGCLSLVPSTLLAQAKMHPTFAAAVEAAPDSGGMVVVLLHGSDWNSFGEQFLANVFKSKELAKNLDRSVALVAVDHKESPSAKDKQVAEGANKLPAVNVRTYPSILITDGQGRALVVLQPLDEFDSGTALATQLQQWYDRICARDQMLVQAQNTSGHEQVRILGEALRVGEVGLGLHLKDARKFSLHEILDAMKKADPQDESGWIFATAFPFDEVVKTTERLLKESGLPAAETELDQRLTNPHLLPAQRQELQRQRFLLYKSAGEPVERLTSALKQCAAEMPDSIIGQGAINWAKHLEKK